MLQVIRDHGGASLEHVEVPDGHLEAVGAPVARRETRAVLAEAARPLPVDADGVEVVDLLEGACRRGKVT